MKKSIVITILCILILTACSTSDKIVSYSDEELCKMAGDYYADQHDGIVPSEITIDSVSEDGRIVKIHLYENLEDHSVTKEWYDVDRYTGVGTNVNFEEIDLKETLEVTQ